MLSLELLLAALLVATLLFGFKLERKLRALRDNQAGFIKALSELDGAAARTENGLEMLRQATDEARGALVPQIEAARDVARRLEQSTSDAELAARRAEAAAESVQESARMLARAVPRRELRVEAPPAPVHAAPVPKVEQEPEPALALEPSPRRGAPDFAALLAAATPRQPLPGTLQPQPKTAGSRLREAAALLRGG
jgi:hypothetical protein